MLAQCLNNDQWFALVALGVILFAGGIKLGYRWGKNDWYSKGYVRGLGVGQSGRQISK
jgi:hypothetical protein